MSSKASPLHPRLAQTLRGFTDEWNRLGEQVGFFVMALVGIRDAVGKYRHETARAIAELGMGVGRLALIGGSVTLIFTVQGNIGVLVGVQGQANLSRVGVEALDGIFTPFITTRLAVPVLVAVGLAATVGAATTAKIGAMRINEEIDALEVIGIRTIPYVVSTRLLAGLIVTLPLTCIGTIATYLAADYMFLSVYGNSTGGYGHYVQSYVSTTDTLRVTAQVMLQGFAIMLIHTYYGYTAAGGPPGVGEATGRAVRASLVTAMFVTMLAGLALYGRLGSFHLSA